MSVGLDARDLRQGKHRERFTAWQVLDRDIHQQRHRIRVPDRHLGLALSSGQSDDGRIGLDSGRADADEMAGNQAAQEDAERGPDDERHRAHESHAHAAFLDSPVPPFIKGIPAKPSTIHPA